MQKTNSLHVLTEKVNIERKKGPNSNRCSPRQSYLSQNISLCQKTWPFFADFDKIFMLQRLCDGLRRWWSSPESVSQVLHSHLPDVLVKTIIQYGEVQLVKVRTFGSIPTTLSADECGYYLLAQNHRIKVFTHDGTERGEFPYDMHSCTQIRDGVCCSGAHDDLRFSTIRRLLPASRTSSRTNKFLWSTTGANALVSLDPSGHVSELGWSVAETPHQLTWYDNHVYSTVNGSWRRYSIKGELEVLVPTTNVYTGLHVDENYVYVFQMYVPTKIYLYSHDGILLQVVPVPQQTIRIAIGGGYLYLQDNAMHVVVYEWKSIWAV